MKARPPCASFLARASTLLFAASLGGGGSGSLFQHVRAATDVVGRWGQSSLLLTPVDDPTFYIISGKSYIAGQTLTSTPTTASSLSLSLHSAITDLTSPPWIESTSSPSGPLSAYGSALALSSTTALFFGGDATGDATEVVQSGNDSSWLLAYPTSGSQNWTHEAARWAGQPMRRELAYAASATNGTVSRGWIFGGMRSDGSGVGLSELWEVQLRVGKAGLVSGGVWQQSPPSAGMAPPAMWDGQAVLMPSTTTGGLPSIYLIGGVQIIDGVTSLVSMSSIWVFTPSNSLGSGTWRQASVANAPEARRGHVAVEIGDGKIWMQGGRTLDGSAVRSDSAVLDVITGTWTTAAVGEAVWGHSAALIGETVVMAFGYGLNGPVSTSLSVYAPGNDTFLSAYYPSYEVIISNPKASGSSPLASTAIVAGPTSAPLETSQVTYVSSALVTEASSTAWIAVTTSTSLSVVQQTMGAATSPQPTAASNPSSSTSTDAPWIAPGGPSSSDSASDPSSNSDPPSIDSNDSSSEPTSKAVVAGAVVGSLLGALALVGAGLLVARRRQQRRDSRGPYAYPALTAGRRRGGYRGGEGSSGLMAGAGAATSSEEYNLEKPLPAIKMSEDSSRTPVVGFLAAIGLLTKGARGTPKQQEKGRFAMLEDEESEAWDSLNSRQRGEKGNHHTTVMGWTTFGEEEEMEEKSSGRGGTGVWDGYDFGGEGGMAKAGRAMSESVKSGRSFLTNALGGFVPLPASEEDEERRLDATPLGVQAAAVLTPINEDYEDDRDHDMDARLSSNDHGTTETTGTRSTGTHHTSSTGPTSSGASNGNLSRLNSHNTPTRPFSPATSLYGSTFNSPSSGFVGLSPSPTKRHAPSLAAVGGPGGGMSRSSSANSNLLDRSRSNSSSWWGRLARRPSLADEPTSTASLGIRDPAPAPRMGLMEAIEEKSPQPSSSSPDPLAGTPLLVHDDPFADPSPSASRSPLPFSNSLNLHHLTQPDEQGRLSVRALNLKHHRSISSNASSSHSQATATSSVLEERMRGMDVIQRMRTGSGSTLMSEERTPGMGSNEEGGGFGRLPERSEDIDEEGEDEEKDGAEEESEHLIQARRESLATQSQGRLVFAGSAAGSIRTCSPEPLLRSPTRLLGPRPPPPSLSLSIPTPNVRAPAPTTAGSAGVRAIVQRFEERASPSLPSSGATFPLPKSNSMSSFVAKEPTSPTKALARERRSTLGGDAGGGEGGGGGSRRKLERGLARKPVLYVANPDA